MITRARLKIRGDSFSLSGGVALPSATLAALQPRERGVWVRAFDAAGHHIVHFDVLGTDTLPAAGALWRISASGNKWTYRSVGRPVQQLKLARIPATSTLTFSMRGSTNVLPAPPLPFPLRIELILDPPFASTGQCAEAVFLAGPPPECTLGARDVVVCAPR